MKVTEIRLEKMKNFNRMQARGSIVFDDCFVVNNVKVILEETGLFVAMPGERQTDGTFKDLAHPIKAELRSHITKEVLKHYKEMM